MTKTQLSIFSPLNISRKQGLTFSQKDVKYISVLVRGLAINLIVEVG